MRQLAIKRSEIVSYATESCNPNNAQRAKLITIETPSPRLASGLTLVDTPGVGGVYEEHSRVTLGFLPRADAIVFVTDATQPLTKTELAFVRRAAETAQVTDDADAQLFILTKIDIVGDFEAILSNTRTKLAEATGRPAESLIVTPVSARAKLAYLRSGYDEYLELSKFSELERVIWAALTRRQAKTVLGAALGDLAAANRSVLHPLEIEGQALQRRAGEQTAALAAQADERASRLAELRDGRSAWRDELRAELARVCQDLHRRAHAEIDELWHRCETVYLHKDVYLSDPNRLVTQAAADAALAVGSVSELAAREAARVLREFSALHGLTLQNPGIGRLPDPPVPAADVSADPTRDGHAKGKINALDEAARGTGVGGTMGAAAGATIGAIIGTLLLPGGGTIAGLQYGGFIGSALGSMYFGLTAYKSAMAEVEEEDVGARRQRIWIELDPVRKAQETHFDDTIDDLIGAFIPGVITELESRIMQEQESVADTLSRLNAVRTATERQAEERRGQLALECQPLGRIRERVDGLAAAVSQLGAAASPAAGGDRARPQAGIGGQGNNLNRAGDGANWLGGQR